MKVIDSCIIFAIFVNWKWFRLLGYPALLRLSRLGYPLPDLERPLYSTAMEHVVTCFTGFRDRAQVVSRFFLQSNGFTYFRMDLFSPSPYCEDFSQLSNPSPFFSCPRVLHLIPISFGSINFHELRKSLNVFMEDFVIDFNRWYQCSYRTGWSHASITWAAASARILIIIESHISSPTR